MSSEQPQYHTTTPRIFLIAEICRSICDFVVEADNFVGEDCQALTSTCKATYEPALDALWRDCRNFRGLINYCRDNGQTSVVDAMVSESVSGLSTTRDGHCRKRS